METPSTYTRRFPIITEPSFNIGRLALDNPEDRIDALDDFMKSPNHNAIVSSRLRSVKGDSPSTGDLYVALARVLRKGPVRFQSLVPSEMRLHWDRMVFQQISFLKKNMRRSSHRHEERLKRLAAMMPSDPEMWEAAPELCPDSPASSFDAARKDLRELIDHVEQSLSPRERFRLHALLDLMHSLGRLPSQREVAQAAGCCKTSIAKLLIAIRELAPHRIRVRQSECGST